MEGSKHQSHENSDNLLTKKHPIFEQIEAHLRRLIPISHTTSSSLLSSSSMISHKLQALQDLHECVETLLQSPMTRQTLVQGREEKWTDRVLEGSLRLLDTCSSAKDSVLHTKECAREVQSTLRRRRGESEFEKYFASRKVVKKSIHKALKTLKSFETKGSAFSCETTTALVGILREVELVTLWVFESLLWFVCGTKTLAMSSTNKWSLVSRIFRSKRVGCEGDQRKFLVNEFENVDDLVHSLMTSIKFDQSCTLEVENVKTQLQSLEFCVQEFEERLERLFRRLIRTRVSLLNILNN